MITNFVIHDGALRPRVIRARAPFAVIPAASRDLLRRPARLICRWTIDSATGALSANWTEVAFAADASQDTQAGHCSRPKAAADIAAVVCFGIFQRIAGGLNRGGPIERRP